MQHIYLPTCLPIRIQNLDSSQLTVLPQTITCHYSIPADMYSALYSPHLAADKVQRVKLARDGIYTPTYVGAKAKPALDKLPRKASSERVLPKLTWDKMG
jgi:hypothetical protein